MRFLRYWLPLIAYGVLIFVQSHHPVPQEISSWQFSDKALHIAGYGLLGALFYRAYRSRPEGSFPTRVAAASVLSTVLYGLSDEIHQYFVPARSADPLDLLADALGGFLGVLIYQTLVARIAPHLPSSPD